MATTDASTQALQQVLCFALAGEAYALPILKVREIQAQATITRRSASRWASPVAPVVAPPAARDVSESMGGHVCRTRRRGSRRRPGGTSSS